MMRHEPCILVMYFNFRTLRPLFGLMNASLIESADIPQIDQLINIRHTVDGKEGETHS